MRLDAHHHVWDDSVRDAVWAEPYPVLHRAFTLDDLAPSLAAHHLDRSVLVQTRSSYDETLELLAEAGRRSTVHGVVGWADLAAPDLAGRLDQLAEAPGGDRLVGVRHQVEDEPDQQWLSRPDVGAGLAELASRGVTYDLLVRLDQLPSAVRAARALPALRFVLDHAGKPAIATGSSADWFRGIEDLAALPNCAVKLSGLVTLAGPRWRVADLEPYADHVLAQFGADRVMFGSDWPVCLIAAGYDEVVAAAEALTSGLSPAERALVFGGTALAWYAR
ncbi:MAG: L-fuconolactonase [Frankiales bacterium]|nr:L-fuconolactonase [Frankiales bacterium]